MFLMDTLVEGDLKKLCSLAFHFLAVPMHPRQLSVYVYWEESLWFLHFDFSYLKVL